MSLNIQKLKITLNTNIPGKKPIEFTKDVLYHPEYNSFTDIEKYPYITGKQLYPESYLGQLHYDEIVNIFFNRTKFERMLLENKPTNTSTDTNFVYKTNVMTMLQLLFSTKYFIVNNIHQSLDIITNKDSKKSLFYNPFNTKFSYLKINGTPYTVTKAIWLNDIVNHPKYNELMKAVRGLVDDYTEKEYSLQSIIQEQQRPFDASVKFGDLSYTLRNTVLPNYRHPFRESSNKRLQKYIIGAKNKNEDGPTSKSDDVTNFYTLFDNIYDRYMLNNKDIKIDETLLDVGIDNINIGYSDSYPKKEIFVLLDVIKGEVNDDNKKEVYCPYTNDYLGNLLNNLVYKIHSTKVLDKPRSIYSMLDKKSTDTQVDTNMKPSTNKISTQNTADKNSNNAETLFYTQLFNRTDEENRKILNKINPIILPSNDIFTFIKDKNNELYTIITKSSSTPFRTNTSMNEIDRIISKYKTEITISNEYLNQSNILPDKIQETKKAITLYELYLLILNNIKKYEATKPISTGGKKSIKNKKKVFNNTKKKI